MIIVLGLIFQIAYAPDKLDIRVNSMSTWLSYPMRGQTSISTMIPKGTQILPLKIFPDEPASPRILLNVYETRSSFFHGKRLEVVTVVRQTNKPNKIHYVVLDCLTDTFHWDPKRGIQIPNAVSFFRTKRGEHVANIIAKEQKLKIRGTLGKQVPITRAFAVDANYLCFFRDSPRGVSLRFSESQLMQDVTLLENLDVDTNIWSSHRGELSYGFVHTHEMDFTAGSEYLVL